MSNDNTESISAKLRSYAKASKDFFGPAYCVIQKSIYECPNKPCYQCEIDLFVRIADEIDREMDELRESFANPRYVNIENAVRDVALGIDDHGRTKDAIERWYNPKPIDERGEPVDLGQPVDDKARGEMEVSRVCYTRNGFYFNNSRDGSGRRKMKGITYSYGERVGRPEQTVLDAVGVPIEVGETVWTTVRHDKFTVASLHGADGTVECVDEVGKSWEILPSDLTHREPDTQERIDGDALKGDYEYWGCNGVECTRCPALVDGKKPKERYGVLWCIEAKTLDLLRRQRELDGRDA
jgi:hypothetical protein